MKFRFIVGLFFLVCAVTSCRKGELAEPTYLSTLKIELINLPNTPDVEVIVGEDVKMGPITPSGAGGTLQVKASDNPVTVRAYLPGSATPFAETMITLPKNSTTVLRLAYSEDFDLKQFITGATEVHPDSTKIVGIFNNLPDALQPGGVELDAELSITNDAVTFYSTVVIENFEKNKLQYKDVMMASSAKMQAQYGADYVYLLKFKNRSTGQYLVDNDGYDFLIIELTGGKSTVVKVESYSWIAFKADYVDL